MRVFLAPLAIWIQAVDSASALRACPAFRPFPFASLTLSITCPQSALIVLNVAERPDLYARTAGPALIYSSRLTILRPLDSGRVLKQYAKVLPLNF